MFILNDVPLSAYSTMRVGGKAKHLTDITDKHEIAEAIAWAEERLLPVIMIGGGSNIIWRDEGFPGLVLVNKIMGFETFEQDSESLYVTVGAGENWDEVVGRVVDLGYSGIEFLSLIPGTAGATPVQNVGAYGREIAEVLTTVEAFDTQTKQLINIPAADCGFGYRTSRFKVQDKGRFMITAVTLHVMKQNPTPPFYATLQTYLTEHKVTQFTPAVIRSAVVDIRSRKLPDPASVANNGSFFKNPIISKSQLVQLQEQYPTITYWDLPNDQVKLSAGWLVEQAGFKGAHDDETGMAIWPAQSLVLVNEHAERAADVFAFREKIVEKVRGLFNVTLEQEPEILP